VLHLRLERGLDLFAVELFKVNASEEGMLFDIGHTCATTADSIFRVEVQKFLDQIIGNRAELSLILCNEIISSRQNSIHTLGHALWVSALLLKVLERVLPDQHLVEQDAEAEPVN